MKKIAILVTIITVIISFGCNKDGKMVETTISGQLRTNGTQDIIKMNTELSAPTVDVYHVYWSGTAGAFSGGGYTYEKIATIPVSSDGKYSITLDLNDNDDYYVGYNNIDTSIYIQKNYSFYNHNRTAYNHIDIGEYNNIILYIGAKSWVIPRFVNSNPDPNNVDTFDISYGIGGPDAGIVLDDLIGPKDTIMNWVHLTSSGTYYDGYGPAIHLAHHVVGKLTRNGVTENVKIIYNVPPFDTNIVVIEY